MARLHFVWMDSMSKLIRQLLFIISLTTAAQNAVAVDLPALGNAFDINKWVAVSPHVEIQHTKLSILKPKRVWSCNHVKYRVEEASELLYETRDFVRALDILDLNITIDQMMATGRSFFKNALATRQNLFHDSIVEFNVTLNTKNDYAILNSPFLYDSASKESGDERISFVGNETQPELKIRLNYLDVCLESKVHVITVPCLNLMDESCRQAEIGKIETMQLKQLWNTVYDKWSSL
jgi:hypothetical protein